MIMKKITLHTCNLRAEVRTNSIKIQAECGKCRNYLMQNILSTQKWNIFYRSLLEEI